MGERERKGGSHLKTSDCNEKKTIDLVAPSQIKEGSGDISTVEIHDEVEGSGSSQSTSSIPI